MTAPTPGPARHFIGGRFADSVSGQWFDHLNPVTEAPTVKVAKGDRGGRQPMPWRRRRAVFDDGAWSRARPSFRRQGAEQGRRSHRGPLGQRSSGCRPWRWAVRSVRSIPGPHPVAERSAWNFRFFAQEQELAGNESFNRDDNLLTYTITDEARGLG